MKRSAMILSLAVTLSLTSSIAARAAVVKAEYVTGGTLDLTWTPGFGVPNTLEPLVLSSGDGGYSNPSGDHTVGVLTNAIPDEGGISLAATPPDGYDDYSWSAAIFTGAGDSRRGLVVRAQESNGFASCYQFVIQPGLLQLSFRKLIDGTPTTLGTWFTTDLPGGLPAVESWHQMKVEADGATFHLYFDGNELPGGPIVDADLGSGWVGVYNFRFDIGGIPFLVDDLVLESEDATAVAPMTWGGVKAQYGTVLHRRSGLEVAGR